jgi:hypothetical protein
MIWLSLGTWNSKHGHFLTQERIYRGGRWTPFCRVTKRYDSWLGYWKVPKPVSWTLYERSVVFEGIPSDTQEEALINLLRTFGLVPTGNARTDATTYELFLEPAHDARTYRGFWNELVTVAAPPDPNVYELTFDPSFGASSACPSVSFHIGEGDFHIEPDWKISVPDGHAGTASVAYKGQDLKVISADLHLRGGEAALLTLEVWTEHLEAVMATLDLQIEVVSCK